MILLKNKEAKGCSDYKTMAISHVEKTVTLLFNKWLEHKIQGDNQFGFRKEGELEMQLKCYR